MQTIITKPLLMESDVCVIEKSFCSNDVLQMKLHYSIMTIKTITVLISRGQD